MSTSLLLQRSIPLTKTLSFARIFTRPMGGGPRTFPGGLNKWQWKRLHEKKARDKERRLLEQEKQLYQARMRSQIRTKLFSKSDPDSNPEAKTTDHKPMTPEEHVKALADRFMKEGAEDLWNEDDGPLKSDEQPRSTRGRVERTRAVNSPIDLRSLISDKRNLVNDNGNVNSGNYVKTRNYSALSGRRILKNESSEDKSDSDTGNNGKPLARNLGNNLANANSRTMSEYVKNRGFSGKRRFNRNERSSDDDSEFDEEEVVEKIGGWRDVRRMGSSASLGKYDVKFTKRVPLKNLENETDISVSEQVELIRKEFEKKKLIENGGVKEISGEESILSQKR